MLCNDRMATLGKLRRSDRLHHQGPVWCRFLGRDALTFELRGTLPGVGEALKREIAGLVWVGRLLLWGFVGFGCSGFDWTGWLHRAFSGKRLMNFSDLWPICTASHRCHRLLSLRCLDLRMTVGPQTV